MEDIKKCEKANNISINVYTIDEITQKKEKKSHTAGEANTHVTAEEELSHTTYEVCRMLYSFSFNLF